MTNVCSILSAAILFLVPAIANAETSEPVTFRHGGELYTYTVEQVGESRVIRGSVGIRQAPFKLKVGKRMVNGTVNGNDVSFSLGSVKPVRGIVIIDQLAAR